MSSSSSSAAASSAGNVVGDGTLLLVESGVTNVDSALELNLTVTLPRSASAPAPKKKVGLVLVVDRSGSMAGSFERQVVPALLYVAERSIELGIEVRLVLYDSRAEIIRYTPQNFKQVIGALRVNGSTSFRAAFDMTWQAIGEMPTNLDEVVIGFLTDGQNTDASYDASLASLKANLRKAKFGSVCHSIAFSSGHDFAFLNTLRTELGIKEGGFQYAEPSDGPNALQEKLSAVFDVAAVSRVECTLTCTVPGLRFISPSGNDELLDALVHTERAVDAQQFTLRAMCRAVTSLDAAQSHSAHVTCALGDGSGATLTCAVALRAQVVPKAKTGALRAQQNIARLEQLEAACGAAASSGSSDVKALSAKLERAISDMALLQSSADLFSLCGNKNQRRAMFDLIEQFSTKAAEIGKILATLASGGLTNAQKARLSELAHGQQFKQARRQRDLDQRSARNVDTLKKAEQALLAVKIDADALAKVSDDAANEFRCVLTQETWRDFIGEQDAAERDIMCFGLAVQRPESIIDDPTQLRVRDVSVTTVAFAAFEDAVIYKLATDQRFARSDTFDVTAELAVALRGAGREPINAVMPLYIHAEHWKMVLPQLPALLGYLVTLDPLGFNSNQYDCFFLVLGNMAMSMRSPGEKDLRLLLQFHRTAIAVLHDCKWAKRAEQALTTFINTPASRLKDQCPSLVVLVGYLMCLPTATVDALLPTPQAWRKFWLDVFAESLRRASDGVYTSDKLEDARLIVSILVDGNANLAPLDDSALAADHFCDAKRGSPAAEAKAPRRPSDRDDDDDDGNRRGKQAQAAQAANAAAAVKPAAAKAVVAAPAGVKQSGRRRHHELPAELVVDPALEQEVQVAARTLLGIAEPVGGAAGASEQGDKWRVEHLTTAILDALRQFERLLATRAYPSVPSLISLATYVQVFHTMARERGGVAMLTAELDEAAGVASPEMCNAVKAAFVARGEYGNALTSLFAALGDTQCGGAPDAAQTTRSVVQQLRAIIVRGVQLRVNKTAREACEAKTDGSGATLADAEALLTVAHQQLAAQAKSTEERKSRSRVLDHCIASCLRTDDINVFIGWLVSERGFGGSRFSEEFRALLEHFVGPNAGSIALAAEKLAVLLAGRFTHNGTEVFVLDHGRCWVPGARWTSKLERIYPGVIAKIIASTADRAAKEAAESKDIAAAKRVAKATESASASTATSSASSSAAPASDPKGSQKQKPPTEDDFPALGGGAKKK